MADLPLEASRPYPQISQLENQQVTIETPRLILRAARPSDAIPLHEPFSDVEVMRYWSTPAHESLETSQNWIADMIKSSQNGITDFIVTLKEFPAETGLAKQTGELFDTSGSNFTSTSLGMTTSTRTAAAAAQTLKPIGKIGIYRPPPSNEIGFLISRSHWGKGLAKEALTVMLEYLFSLLSSGSVSSPVVSSSTEGDTPSDAAAAAAAAAATAIASYTTTASPPPQPTDSNTETNPHTFTTLPSTDQPTPYAYPCISTDVDPRNKASLGLLERVGFKQIGYVSRSDYIGGKWVDSVFLGIKREEYSSVAKGVKA